ncbi:MAG: TIGR03118 family protein [Ferruginibacter sp.]
MQNYIHKKFGKWFFTGFIALLFFSACNIIRDRLNNLQQVNLVANNGSYTAGRVDPNFVNAWGFDFSPFGPAFISSNGTGTSVVYGTDGEERRSAISIPGPGEIPSTGHPSAVVFNYSNFFFLADFNPARFIYAGSDGVISAWNAGDIAQRIIDNSATASYTGIAIAEDAGASFLYTCNFKEHRIQVYDGSFNEVSMAFTDPTMPPSYSPYNIRSIDGKLYVTYAKETNGNVETGAGKGYVNIFNTDGTLSRRFASAGKLNAPWGITMATPQFWNFTSAQPNSILVGNYGDGRINSYSQSGTSLGPVLMQSGPIAIPGLRTISFAPDSAIAEKGKLFFSAGPNGGQDGLFGYIHEVQP